ncbi:MAG: UDP-N-acetylmuramate--L-alanine ligase [Clostridia bacterium]|nr:UDP-N-acetylmuramate--L-alanine ligase [Clostridia bacterium]
MAVQLFGEKRRVYFIGIGGISMSALAKMLISYGYRVFGYDAVLGRQVQMLREMGATISVGTDDFETLARAEVVVYTDAIAKEDARLVFAQRQRKEIYSRAQLLSLLTNNFSRVIAVAGSHGKTTCTAMCAHAISKAGAPFAVHIGGEDTTFDNFTITGTDFFITEACEYKKNLSYVRADSAVLLNVDKDHLECFYDESELKMHFFQFLKRARTGFVCLDDENCRRFVEADGIDGYITFGINDIRCDYRAEHLKRLRQGYTFWVTEYGKRLCKVRLNVLGRHNVLNALAAVAVLRSYGFPEAAIAEGLENFRGVKRRFERLDDVFNATAIADYAHHPREIAATIKTAKESLFKKGRAGRLYVVFQPHTYSRTKMLLDEFIAVLKPLENLVVYHTFAAREKSADGVDASTLASRLGAIYADNVYALESYLRANVEEGDVVLFLGAGDIYAVAQYLTRLKR